MNNKELNFKYVNVVGAGLAGCEAAIKLADCGIAVRLFEQKPITMSAAHKSENFAELVCSNSLKAARVESAAGLLKAEMALLGSAILKAAAQTSVPAGGALAVDRSLFSQQITKIVKSHPLITVVAEQVTNIDPQQITIIASGPLTQGALAGEIARHTGERQLAFYDAAAPIVLREGIDFTKVFEAARYGRGTDDYINCPFDKEQYERFYSELIGAQRAEQHGADGPLKVYEGCMPIEVLASRGANTMRFGPLKPVGLTDPATCRRPYANVQLRREDEQGTMFNIVGFQTNLKFGEQKRVFSLIPGLENAEFVRYGVMHRNTFINSPALLTAQQNLKSNPNIYFAGQITGTEGYCESAASGILAAIHVARRLKGLPPLVLPPQTMLGALVRYITAPNVDFQPMGANMGILPPLETAIKDKKLKYAALAARALEALGQTLAETGC